MSPPRAIGTNPLSRRRPGDRRRAGLRAAAAADARPLAADRRRDPRVRARSTCCITTSPIASCQGQVPYRDFPLEYPIGCLPQLLLPLARRPRRPRLPAAYVAEMLLVNAAAGPRARRAGRAPRGPRGGPAPAGLVPGVLPVPLPADRQPARRRPGAAGVRGRGGVVRRAGRSAAACSRRSGAWSRCSPRWPSCRRACGSSPDARESRPRGSLAFAVHRSRWAWRPGPSWGASGMLDVDPLPRGARAGDRVRRRGPARCSPAG